MIAFPPFRLDLDEERLWKGETPVTLRRKPLAILRYLVQHPKKLVTHDELLAEVWRGAVVSDSAMRSHMHELRQALGEGVIETVIGRGYRFVAELRDHVVVESAREALPTHPLVVGRDGELAVLRSAFAAARGGERQLCFITGEPGIGKSTLAATFLAGLDAGAALIGRGSCFEQHGTPEPYLAIIDALSGLARSDRRTTILAALMRYAPTFVSQMPQLLEPDQHAEVTHRAAGGNASRQLRELSEALEAIGSKEPLVLLLEDLQWSDIATIDLLSFLGRRQERAKLLVIGTARNADVQRSDHPLNHVMRSLVARSGALSIQVPAIDGAAVQRFIDGRFPGHTFPSKLSELVLAITAGTPLFMVALLDELAGRGMLADRDGTWELTVSVDEVQAHRPASVKQLIDMQLDRLSPVEQRVLEAAAVVGAEFSTSLVAAALEISAEEVDDTCDALARRGLFLRAEPDGRYAVTHALIQEVCIERSSPARRQRWHRLVADALERDPSAGELSQLLAKHFEAAGDAARAIPAYVGAARHAASRYASSDAAALCGRALDLLPRLPASRERDMLELQILGTMCQQVNSSSFSAAFAGRQTLVMYERAIELARRLGDAQGLYGAITQLCNYHMIIAQYDQSAELTAELERIEEAHALDPQLLHAGIFARGYIAFFSGDVGTALRTFERLVAAAHEDSVFQGYLPGRALALGHLACVRWVIGEPDRALDEAVATIELANRIKVPILQALGHIVRTRIRFLRRDALPIVEHEAQAALGAASLDLGLHTEARAFALWLEARRGPLELHAIQPLLDDLQRRLEEVSTCSTLVALMLIDALRLSGHTQHARALTDEIIGFARAHKELVYLPALLQARGEQVEPADPAAAERDYREAIALARATGAISLEQRASARLATAVNPG